MSVLYLAEQGTVLTKQGNRFVIKKGKDAILAVPSFKIDQVVVLGNTTITPQTVAFLLAKGIDTVFLSYSGKYRGRLISRLGKNIELRRAQFKALENEKFALRLASRYVLGKLKNYRTLVRRHNREMKNPEIESATHQLRSLLAKLDAVKDFDSLRGYEGSGSRFFFQCLKHIIKSEGIVFDRRNRRPPRDPINAMLSFGYTLLGNTIESSLNFVGLDPYFGSLHSLDYGRPSLTLDLMEEFRPAIIDVLVIRLLNKKIMGIRDFYMKNEVYYPEDAEEEGDLGPEDYPVLMTFEGLKKFINYYEKQLNQKVFYQPLGVSMTYRDICVAQARMLARCFKSLEDYEPFFIK